MAKAVEAEELPRAIVRRVVKDKLDDQEISINKDALLGFSESARIFIHYLSATANDICKESKRQTISADDVLKALEEIEFPELIEPLKVSLDDFRKKNAGKRSEAKAKEADKKRKMEEESSAQNGDGRGEDAGEDKENENGVDDDE